MQSGLPNDVEITLFAVLVAFTHPDDFKLEKWAADIWRYKPSYDSVGQAGLPSEAAVKAMFGMPDIFHYMETAYKNPDARLADSLEKIAKVIRQTYRGALNVDELCG